MLLSHCRNARAAALRVCSSGAVLALLALCALLAQNVALAGHIHPRDGAGPGLAAAQVWAAHGGGTAIGKATSAQDEDCPLCEARQLAGSSLLPADIVLAPPPPCGVGLFALAPARCPHRALSHRWRSRAPPVLA